MMNHSAQSDRSQTCIVGFLVLALMIVGVSLETAHAESSNSNSLTLYSDQFVRPSERAWIYDVGTLLYADNDEDGHFSGISLSIDADTVYLSYRVFINIDITPVGSNRTERLHTTQPFYIYGNNSTDEYRVDIDLVQNFNPQLYNLSISLVEHGNGIIIDQIFADDARNLRSLSLESEDNEDVFVPVIDQPVDTLGSNVRVEERAGSVNFMLLVILLVCCQLKTRIRSQRD